MVEFDVLGSMDTVERAVVNAHLTVKCVYIRLQKFYMWYYHMHTVLFSLGYNLLLNNTILYFLA